MRVSRVAAAVVCWLWAAGASAQSVYVGGAVAAEVVRTSSTESGGATYDNGNGEAFGGAIRIGTFITERVGIELEYFRPGEIESDAGGPIYLADSALVASGRYSLPEGLLAPDSIFPSVLSQSMRMRASTTSALLTARQPLGGRVELVYLGGVGFSRVVREIEYGYGFPRIAAPAGFGFTTRTTQYGAGPVVGVEIRAGMTEHAQVVAGLRVHTLGQSVVDGWMIRPGVGLTWKF